MSDGILACAAYVFVFFFGIGLGLMIADGQRTPYDKFATDCRASSIETQYAEHAGQRAMVVRCVREAR